MANRPRPVTLPLRHEEDRRVPGPVGEIAVRIFRPAQESSALLVYFHGGGWVLGNLDTHTANCRLLAEQAGCVVMAVDYREAPEHHFPAAADDAYAAAVWAVANAGSLDLDPARVAVGGESAGGNLAAVACLMARARGGPKFRAQWLAYPVIDHNFDTLSYRELSQGYGLDLASMVWFWTHYLGPDGDGAHPYASPIRAESLAGLPPAVVTTCEFDVLRDEGRAYADRLREAGVQVDYHCFEGANHAFLGSPVALARAGWATIGALLRERL